MRFRHLLATVLALSAFVFVSAPAGAGPDPVADEATFVAMINEARTSVGLNALTLDPELQAEARSWARELADSGNLRHAGDLSVGMTADWEVLGENIGVHGAPEIDVLFQAFVDSPGHYQNLVDTRYTNVGVGVVYGDDGKIWTTHRFMGLRPQASAGSEGTPAAATPAPATTVPTTTVPATAPPTTPAPTATRTPTTPAPTATAPASTATPASKTPVLAATVPPSTTSTTSATSTTSTTRPSSTLWRDLAGTTPQRNGGPTNTAPNGNDVDPVPTTGSTTGLSPDRATGGKPVTTTTSGSFQPPDDTDTDTSPIRPADRESERAVEAAKVGDPIEIDIDPGLVIEPTPPDPIDIDPGLVIQPSRSGQQRPESLALPSTTTAGDYQRSPGRRAQPTSEVHHESGAPTTSVPHLDRGLLTSMLTDLNLVGR